MADVTPEVYRRDHNKSKSPHKDMTETWDGYMPLEQAPPIVHETVRVSLCEPKGFDLDSLIALSTRYKINRHGGIVLAWALYAPIGDNGSLVVCGVKRRPLDPDMKRNSEPGSRFGPPALPAVIGDQEALRWIVVEGETDGARMLELTAGKAAILILGSTVGARYREWDALYPEGAEILIALDNDSRLPGEGPEVLRGEEASQILLSRLGPRARRLRPPTKDWCLS